VAGDRKPPVFPARAAGNPFANQFRDLVAKAAQRMQPAGVRGKQAQAPGARFQVLADNAPVGSVGAPGGIQRPGRQPTAQDALSALLAGGAMVPGPVGDVAGPLADAYMYATEPESRTLWNAAMSALGVLPGVPSLAGIFVGKKSGVWDAVAARRAEELEAEGVPPEQIWSETGTWRGPDGQWRQEIDDSAARFNVSTRNGEKVENPLTRSMVGADVGPTVGGILEHPRLAEAYGVDLARNTAIRGDLSPGSAYFDPLRSEIGFAAPMTAETGRTVALHELQHAVQEAEGFFKGGTPNFRMQWAGELPVNPEYADSLNKWNEYLLANGFSRNKLFLPEDIAMNDPEKLENWLLEQGSWLEDKMWPEAVKKVKGLVAQGIPEEQAWEMVDYTPAEVIFTNIFEDKKPLLITPYEAYERLGGEAEARAVAARRDMSAAERRATFPPASYDVPLEHLILRNAVQFGE
jgi:hypothetical protein